MPPPIATIIFVLLILALFRLNRDDRFHTSTALWIPAAWVFLSCSRSVNQWLLGAQALRAADVVDVNGNPTDRLVYAALVVIGLVVVAKRGRRVGELLRGNTSILIFFLYCLVSLLWSDFPGVALKRWIKALGDFVMVLIVLSDAEPAAAVKRLITRAGFFLIPLSVLLIKYYPLLGRTYGRYSGKAFYTGVTLNKNTLGAVSLLFGLGTVWCLSDAFRDREDPNRKRHLIALCTVLAIAMWLLWMADSMTSISCFLMGCGLFFATKSRAVSRSRGLVHLIVTGMLSISAAVLFLGMSPSTLEAMGKDPTLTDRTQMWALALSVIPNRLVGAGFESFWMGPRLQKIWAVFHWQPFEAHNGYIEIYLNLGWMGVILLAAVIATGYRKAISSYRRNLPMSSFMLTLFVVGLMYNFTEAAFFRMMAPVWIFLLLSMTGSLELSYSPKPASQPFRGGRRSRLKTSAFKTSLESK